MGAIAEKAGVSKKTAGLVLSATLDVLVAACLTQAEGWRGEGETLPSALAWMGTRHNFCMSGRVY